MSNPGRLHKVVTVSGACLFMILCGGCGCVLRLLAGFLGACGSLIRLYRLPLSVGLAVFLLWYSIPLPWLCLLWLAVRPLAGFLCVLWGFIPRDDCGAVWAYFGRCVGYGSRFPCVGCEGMKEPRQAVNLPGLWVLSVKESEPWAGLLCPVVAHGLYIAVRVHGDIIENVSFWFHVIALSVSGE